MRNFASFFILFSLSLGRFSAASVSPEVVAQFEAAARKEIDAKRNNDVNRSGGYPASEAARFLSRLEFAAASDDTNRVEQMMNEIPSFFSSEDVTKAALALGEAIKKDREAKQNAGIAEINAAIKQAGDAIGTAKNPADLDQPLKNLSRFRSYHDGGERQSEALRAAQARVSPDITFVQRWQDFLSAKNSNNTNRARESLQGLLNNESSFEFMPRSQILAELQKFPTSEEERRASISFDDVNQIVGKAKTLDDIAAVIKELRAKMGFYSNYGGADPLSATIDTLTAIDRSYREFRTGLPARIDISPSRWPDATSPAVAPLRMQLILLSLPRYLNLPQDLAPKSGETVDTFLNRLSEEARRRGDATLILKLRNLRRVFTFGNSPVDPSPDSNAIASYMAGQNQEAADQFMLAVVSYQNALRAGSDAIPAKLIGDRLRALQSAHPQEYEAGMKAFLNGPAFGSDPHPTTSVLPFLSVPAAPGNSAVPSGSPK